MTQSTTIDSPKTPLLKFSVIKRFPSFRLECEGVIESGVTGIFGPSGSGKTTLLNCIAGLTTPDEGEIEVMGRPVYSSDRRKNEPPEKRRFGYVFQDAALFPHMNVRQNIHYGYRLTSPKRRAIEPDSLVELFQLGALMDRRVANLSGGERHRVALARALATSPELLLLDEPLASLDAVLRGTVLGYLKRVWRELGTPMVYVSHSMSEIMALAENVLVLHDGKVVVNGPPTRVLVHPAVAELVDHASLENLVEAEVVRSSGDGGLAEIRVGKAKLVASGVHKGPGEVVMISIRAGDIILSLDVPRRISARNLVAAVITEIHVLGQRVLVYADVGTLLVVEITASAMSDLALRERHEVYLIVKANSIMVMDSPASVASSEGSN